MVHATTHWGFMPAVVGRFARAGHPARFVLSLHGGLTESFATEWPGLLRWVCAGYDSVTVPSRGLAECLGQLGINAVHLPNILPDIPDGQWPPERQPNSFLSVRVHDSLYRVPSLVKAFAQVVKWLPDATLTIVGMGSGADSKEVDQLAHGLPHNSVRLLSPLQHARIIKEMQHHEFLLSAASQESFGLSVLEGMATGCIPICCAVGNMQIMVEDGTRGFLVHADNPSAIAATMARAAQETAGNKAIIRERIRAYAKSFSWPSLRSQYAETLFGK